MRKTLFLLLFLCPSLAIAQAPDSSRIAELEQRLGQMEQRDSAATIAEQNRILKDQLAELKAENASTRSTVWNALWTTLGIFAVIAAAIQLGAVIYVIGKTTDKLDAFRQLLADQFEDFNVDRVNVIKEAQEAAAKEATGANRQVDSLVKRFAGLVKRVDTLDKRQLEDTAAFRKTIADIATGHTPKSAIGFLTDYLYSSISAGADSSEIDDIIRSLILEISKLPKRRYVADTWQELDKLENLLHIFDATHQEANELRSAIKSYRDHIKRMFANK